MRVIEIFPSIQGESSFAGLPFAFIRLAGCNLRCRWCDTAHSRKMEAGFDISIDDISDKIIDIGMKHVCITGGEPLLQDDTPVLVEHLKNLGRIVTIETNGTLDIGPVAGRCHVIMDVKCPSSGMTSFNQIRNISLLTPEDEVKFVIADRRDYEFARDIYGSHLQRFEGPILMSPVWDHLKPVSLAKWILCDKIPVRLQLQIHKYVGLK